MNFENIRNEEKLKHRLFSNSKTLKIVNINQRTAVGMNCSTIAY